MVCTRRCQCYVLTVKTPDSIKEQFVVDAAGKPVAVLLDLPTYERLREAEEDGEDVARFDAALPGALAELQAGECVSLEDYLLRRKRTLPPFGVPPSGGPGQSTRLAA